MLPFLLATLLFIGEREVQTDSAATGPKLTAPAQIQAQPGKHFQVKLDTNCKWLKWVLPPGLERVPVEMAGSDKVWIGYGPAGVYEFTILGSLNDVHTECKCVVFVGQPQPGPPAPGPSPADPFTAELQPLFTADKGTTDQRDKMCELWKSAAVHVDSNPEFTTMREFTEAMHATSKKFPFNLSEESLPAIRKKMAVELTVVCGPGATELGPPKSECRKKAAALLNRYAVALGGVK